MITTIKEDMMTTSNPPKYPGPAGPFCRDRHPYGGRGLHVYCTAQPGHDGPVHVAFEPDGRALTTWPIEPGEPDLGTAGSVDAAELVDVVRRFAGDVVDLAWLAAQWTETGAERRRSGDGFGPGSTTGKVQAAEAVIYGRCANELRNAITKITQRAD